MNRLSMRLAKHDERIDRLLDEFEEARMMAVAMGNPSAMVSATLGKAKILGLDKNVLDVNHNFDPSKLKPLADLFDGD